MDRNGFWKIIEDARQDSEEAEETASAVIEHLQTLEADEIISFDQHIYDLLAESYRWDLWAVAYIINGGCSDDGFDYFRGWLIAQGRERYESALKKPEAAGEWAELDEAECEDLIGAGFTAYLAKTGSEMPEDAVKSSIPPEPIGEAWEEDQLEELYPDLCEKFEM